MFFLNCHKHRLHITISYCGRRGRELTAVGPIKPFFSVRISSKSHTHIWSWNSCHDSNNEICWLSGVCTKASEKWDLLIVISCSFLNCHKERLHITISFEAMSQMARTKIECHWPFQTFFFCPHFKQVLHGIFDFLNLK